MDLDTRAKQAAQVAEIALRGLKESGNEYAVVVVMCAPNPSVQMAVAGAMTTSMEDIGPELIAAIQGVTGRIDVLGRNRIANGEMN